MKESTYLDLSSSQKDALIKAVDQKHHNLHDKYKQVDTLKKYYEDEIGKIGDEIKGIEVDLQNTARGIIPIKISVGKKRLGIDTTKLAIKKMTDTRRSEDNLMDLKLLAKRKKND